WGVIIIATYVAGRIRIPRGDPVRVCRSMKWISLVRTTIPVLYVALAAILANATGPTLGGLVSTFPSMSVATLAVTHLEEGPAQASQIARTLPLANLSTAVFLAVFRFACPAIGLGWGTLCGFAAALANTITIEIVTRRQRARTSLAIQYPK